MQCPRETQHQQRSPGPSEVAAGTNKGGTNKPSVTPTRKTRRGKRGGRGRSLSPRTGLPGGAVGAGGRAAGMGYQAAVGSWFPNHQRHFSGSQLGHGPPSLLPPAPPFLWCHQPHQQQHQQQHQQREQREEVLDMKPVVAAGATMATAVSASTAAWGGQVSSLPTTCSSKCSLCVGRVCPRLPSPSTALLKEAAVATNVLQRDQRISVRTTGVSLNNKQSHFILKGIIDRRRLYVSF